MRMIVLVALCSLCGVTAAEGPAAEATSASSGKVIGATEAASRDAYEKRVVCKPEAVVGTRITKKVCRTQAQMDAEAENVHAYLERIQAGARGQSKTLQ